MSERLGCLKAISSLQAVHKAQRGNLQNNFEQAVYKAQRGRYLPSQRLLKQNIKTCIEWAIYCPRGLV